VDGRVELRKGTLLDGTYHIERTIGAGGFGIIYAAQDVGLSARVAVKEYYPEEFGDRDSTMSVRPKSERHKATFEWGRSSFVEEARTLARFRHPSVVRVSRVFERNSTAYMVMVEPGESLESWLKRLGRPPTQEELDRIAAPLLDALEMMHAEEFLHRDIAPDNIIIRANGTPVLLDFGAARRAVAEKTRTLTGILKAGYSPQEQHATDGRLQGPWSDLYAFGATFRSAMKVAQANYRPEFLVAIDHCLKVRRTERPQTVAEPRPMLLGQTRATRPIAQPENEARKRPGRSDLRADAPPRAPSGKGALKWLIAAAILAVLGGAYGGFEFSRHRGDFADDARRRQADANTEAERQRATEAKRQADADAARRNADEEEARAAAEVQRRAEEQAEAEKRAVEERKLLQQRRAEEAAARARAQAEALRRAEEAEAARRRVDEERQQAEARKRAEQEEQDRRRAEEEMRPTARSFNPSARPSFDCTAYSRTPLGAPSRIPQSEILCLDVEVADADREMGEALRRKPEDARAGQLQWIVWRNSQCPATWADVHNDRRVREIGACLAEASRNRMRELSR
jgi:tRNA A-37 threonylcarbamoyl transferase component Bud32